MYKLKIISKIDNLDSRVSLYCTLYKKNSLFAKKHIKLLIIFILTCIFPSNKPENYKCYIHRNM